MHVVASKWRKTPSVLNVDTGERRGGGLTEDFSLASSLGGSFTFQVSVQSLH